MDVLRDAHAPEDDGRLRTRIAARHRAQGLRRDAADRRHLLRRELLDLLGKGFEIRGLCLDILPVVEALADDCIENAIEHRDVGARLELQHMRRMALERLPARIHHNELRTALGRLLEERRRYGMVLGRICPDNNDDV